MNLFNAYYLPVELGVVQFGDAIVGVGDGLHAHVAVAAGSRMPRVDHHLGADNLAVFGERLLQFGRARRLRDVRYPQVAILIVHETLLDLATKGH